MTLNIIGLWKIYVFNSSSLVSHRFFSFNPDRNCNSGERLDPLGLIDIKAVFPESAILLTAQHPAGLNRTVTSNGLTAVCCHDVEHGTRRK